MPRLLSYTVNNINFYAFFYTITISFCLCFLIIFSYETRVADDLFTILGGIGFCGIFVFPAFYSLCVNGRHSDKHIQDDQESEILDNEMDPY